MQGLSVQLMLMSTVADPTGLFFSLQLIHFIVCILGYIRVSVECHSFVYFLMQHTLCDGERREFAEWRMHKKQAMAC